MIGVLVPEGVRRYSLERITDPEVYPWSLEYVRDEHLKVSNGTAEDAKIRRLMAAAYRHAEQWLRRSLAFQRWRYELDRFPVSGGIKLPYPPALEVESISYLDGDGVRTVWGDGSPWPYDVILPRGPRAPMAEIIPEYGGSWPGHRTHAGSVRIEFTAGYADGSPAEVPEDVAEGMLLIIAELYKQRSESVHAFSQNPALVGALRLWRPYRVE